MTSNEKSSKSALTPPSMRDVEILGGVFHPFDIEVQDFSCYALMVDVRSAADFADDHIPGAVRLDPSELSSWGGASPPLSVLSTSGVDAPWVARDGAGDLPPVLSPLVSPVKRNEAILVYCGRGGLDSAPLARALRGMGWTVDVLGGGWASYRRWVKAGVDLLPTCVSFRVVDTALGGEAARVLGALRALDQQVLDLQALAGWRHGALAPQSGEQPAQAWFESQIVQAMRWFDPRRAVWISEVPAQLGALQVPAAMIQALTRASSVAVEVPMAERLRAWQDDEAGLLASVRSDDVGLAGPGGSLPSLLAWQIEAGHAVLVKERSEHRTLMPPLAADSLAPEALKAALRGWLLQHDPQADDN
jgi:tRNA 2-selenouridine synthase